MNVLVNQEMHASHLWSMTDIKYSECHSNKENSQHHRIAKESLSQAKRCLAYQSYKPFPNIQVSDYPMDSFHSHSCEDSRQLLP